jgi:hypothetical protein
VVRRQDIESFWRIPESQRLMFFFDYLDSRQAAQQREEEVKLRGDLQAAIEEHSRAANYRLPMLLASARIVVDPGPMRHAPAFEQVVHPHAPQRPTHPGY